MDENMPTLPPQPIATPVPVGFPKKNNLVVILLTVLLLVFVSASIFLALQVQNLTKQLTQSQIQAQATPTPTSDPTADWKTYINTEFKFSFKYPDIYFKYLKDYPDIGVYLAPTEGIGEAKGSPIGLTKEDVWIDATTQSGANIDSLEQFFNLKGQGTEFELFYVQSPKEKIIVSDQAGYKIKQYQQYGPQNVSTLRAIFLKNSILYYFAMSAYDTSILQKNEQLFDQILSTFKFIK